MSFLNTLSGAITTTDVMIIFVVFAFIFFYSIRYGKSNSVSLLVSIYIGILTFLSFPYLKEATLLNSSEAQVTISHIVVFFVGIFIINTIIRRFIFTEYSNKKFMKYIEISILSGVSTALLFAFAYHTISLATIYNFSDSINNLFLSQYFFWWLITPLVGLILVSNQ